MEARRSKKREFFTPQIDVRDLHTMCRSRSRLGACWKGGQISLIISSRGPRLEKKTLVWGRATRMKVRLRRENKYQKPLDFLVTLNTDSDFSSEPVRFLRIVPNCFKRALWISSSSLLEKTVFRVKKTFTTRMQEAGEVRRDPLGTLWTTFDFFSRNFWDFRDFLIIFRIFSNFYVKCATHVRTSNNIVEAHTHWNNPFWAEGDRGSA